MAILAPVSPELGLALYVATLADARCLAYPLTQGLGSSRLDRSCTMRAYPLTQAWGVFWRRRSVDVPTPVIPAYHDVYGYLEPESAQLATSSITLLAYPLTLGQRSVAAADGVKQQVGYTDTRNEHPFRAEILERRVT